MLPRAQRPKQTRAGPLSNDVVATEFGEQMTGGKKYIEWEHQRRKGKDRVKLLCPLLLALLSAFFLAVSKSEPHRSASQALRAGWMVRPELCQGRRHARPALFPREWIWKGSPFGTLRSSQSLPTRLLGSESSQVWWSLWGPAVFLPPQSQFLKVVVMWSQETVSS